MKHFMIHWWNGKVTTHPDYEAMRLCANALMAKRMVFVEFQKGY